MVAMYTARRQEPQLHSLDMDSSEIRCWRPHERKMDMIDDDMLKLAIPAMVAAIASLPVLWVKYFSARVTLRNDLRLLRLARDSGIDVSVMEAGIQAQIKAIYTKGKNEAPATPEPETVVGNLFIAMISLVFAIAGALGFVDGISKGLKDGAGDLAFGGLIMCFFAFGTFVGIRDAIELVRKRARERKSAQTSQVRVAEATKS